MICYRLLKKTIRLSSGSGLSPLPDMVAVMAMPVSMTMSMTVSAVEREMTESVELHRRLPEIKGRTVKLGMVKQFDITR